jgi:hypothetical protein
VIASIRRRCGAQGHAFDILTWQPPPLHFARHHQFHRQHLHLNGGTASARRRGASVANDLPQRSGFSRWRSPARRRARWRSSTAVDGDQPLWPWRAIQRACGRFLDRRTCRHPGASRAPAPASPWTCPRWPRCGTCYDSIHINGRMYPDVRGSPMTAPDPPRADRARSALFDLGSDRASPGTAQQCPAPRTGRGGSCWNRPVSRRGWSHAAETGQIEQFFGQAAEWYGPATGIHQAGAAARRPLGRAGRRGCGANATIFAGQEQASERSHYIVSWRRWSARSGGAARTD